MKYLLFFIFLFYSCDVTKSVSVNSKPIYSVNTNCGSFDVKSFLFRSDLYLIVHSNTDSLVVNTDSLELLTKHGAPLKIYETSFYDSRENEIRTPLNNIKKGKIFKCVFRISDTVINAVITIPISKFVVCPSKNSELDQNLELNF